jgi:cell division septation protein DedD
MPGLTACSRGLFLATCLGSSAALVACSASHQPSEFDAGRHLSYARSGYHPPGPPEDPWSPYFADASKRFDIPASWIRAVMRQESGGRLYRTNGELIISSAGAVGLMQVMPGTYDELRTRYDLGGDPFHPRDNIMAGVAYMREMYDIYGSPGFLAAYNAGPTRLDDYLTNVRSLPDETRRYVAIIAPNLDRDHPAVRSPAEQYEMNKLPPRIAAGLRNGDRGVVVTSRGPLLIAPAASSPGRLLRRSSSELPQLSVLSSRNAVPTLSAPRPNDTSKASGVHQIAKFGGPQLVAPAREPNGMISQLTHSLPGGWAIQVGAFADQQQAHRAVSVARNQAWDELSAGKTHVGGSQHQTSLVYRARIVGLSRDSAMQGCERISRSRSHCIVLSPKAQL